MYRRYFEFEIVILRAGIYICKASGQLYVDVDIIIFSIFQIIFPRTQLVGKNRGSLQSDEGAGRSHHPIKSKEKLLSYLEETRLPST